MTEAIEQPQPTKRPRRTKAEMEEARAQKEAEKAAKAAAKEAAKNEKAQKAAAAQTTPQGSVYPGMPQQDYTAGACAQSAPAAPAPAYPQTPYQQGVGMAGQPPLAQSFSQPPAPATPVAAPEARTLPLKSLDDMTLRAARQIHANASLLSGQIANAVTVRQQLRDTFATLVCPFVVRQPLCRGNGPQDYVVITKITGGMDDATPYELYGRILTRQGTLGRREFRIQWEKYPWVVVDGYMYQGDIPASDAITATMEEAAAAE